MLLALAQLSRKWDNWDRKCPWLDHLDHAMHSVWELYLLMIKKKTFSLLLCHTTRGLSAAEATQDLS